MDVGGFGFACKTDKLRLITSKLVPEGEARTLDDLDVCVKPIKTLRGFRRKKVHQSVTRTDTWEMKGSGGEIKLVWLGYFCFIVFFMEIWGKNRKKKRHVVEMSIRMRSC